MSYYRKDPSCFLSIESENKKHTFSIFLLQSKKHFSYTRKTCSHTSPRTEGRHLFQTWWREKKLEWQKVSLITPQFYLHFKRNGLSTKVLNAFFFFFLKKIEHNVEIIAKLRVNGDTYQILWTAVYCLTLKISSFEFLS